MSVESEEGLLSALHQLTALLGAYLGAEQRASVSDAELDEIVDGFVLLDSQATLSRRLAAAHASGVLTELARLRERAHALRHTRTRCTALATDALNGVLKSAESIAEADAELRGLDASKRYKIATDVVSGLAPQWLETIRTDVFGDKLKSQYQAFAAEFDKEEYAKNIVGALIDTVNQASHAAEAAGLTARVLSDMAFALVRTLSSELRRHLPGGRVTDTHVKVLEDRVLRVFISELVRVWRLTARVSAAGSARQGEVVASFRQADLAEKARLREIKARGVDAKFEGSHVDVDIDERVAEFSALVRRIAGQLGAQVQKTAPPTQKAQISQESTPHEALLNAIRQQKQEQQKAAANKQQPKNDNDVVKVENHNDFSTRLFSKPIVQADYLEDAPKQE